MKKIIILISILFPLIVLADNTSINDELCNAAYQGNISKVKDLIKKGADVNARKSYDDLSEYPLSNAASEGHLDIVILLLKNGADANSFLALSNASSKGYIDIVKQLISHGADVNIENGAPLKNASLVGHYKIVKLLIDNKANVNVDKNSPIRNAISGGHIEIVKLLIENGANVNYLCTAIYEKQADIAKLLLSKGAKIDGSCQDNTILDEAIKLGDIELVNQLIDKGFKVNGKGALFAGASNGQIDIVKLAIKNNADVNSTDEIGETPLLHASSRGFIDIVKLLLEKGADVNAKNKRNESALIDSTIQNHEEVVKVLISYGADINARDNKGNTPFMYASLKGYKSLINLLAANGADTNTKTDFKIGERGPAGGWIFYDKGNYKDGWRYLEAAPEDLSEEVYWSNIENKNAEATGETIGSGKLNTQRIITAYGAGNYAAKRCSEYKGGGRIDWFLPSKDELKLIHNNLYRIGIGNFANGSYWSSTEYYTNEAWIQAINYKTQIHSSKYSNKKVRAIRAF